jgi:hypothetical protein
MKTFIAFLTACASVYGFIGLAEASIFDGLFSSLYVNLSNTSGQFSWPVVFTLLVSGIVGILGIRRRGKKSE